MGWATKEKRGQATTLHPRAGQKVALPSFHLLTLADRDFCSKTMHTYNQGRGKRREL